jgi:hypothetical protein
LGGPFDDLFLNDLLSEVVDDIAAQSDIFMVEEVMDSTGTPSVPMKKICVPNVTKLKAGGVKRGGTWHPFEEIRSTDYMDDAFTEWRFEEYPAACDFVVIDRPHIWLFPWVTESVTGGLKFYGYGVPGDSWAEEADLYPLPAHTVSCCVNGAAARYCLARPSDENIRRQSPFQGLFEIQGRAFEEMRGS